MKKGSILSIGQQFTVDPGKRITTLDFYVNGKNEIANIEMNDLFKEKILAGIPKTISIKREIKFNKFYAHRKANDIMILEEGARTTLDQCLSARKFLVVVALMIYKQANGEKGLLSVENLCSNLFYVMGKDNCYTVDVYYHPGKDNKKWNFTCHKIDNFFEWPRGINIFMPVVLS